MGMSIGEIDLGLNVNRQQFNRQLQGLSSGAEKQVNSSFSGIGKKIGAVIGVAMVGSFVKSCVELGSNLTEVQNVVDTTFTSMAGKVNDFAKVAMTNFGMSETMAKKYAGTLGTMSKSMGFTEKSAFDMATSVTKLGGDVASFYNLSQDEAMTKLKAIWTGETEAIKDLGVVMTQSALDQYALNNGFGKTTAKMTEQEKVMLRYKYVMSSLSGAQGDFARTSGSWANQTRILSLQFDSLKASLGQGFINLFTPIIQVINSLLGKLVSLATGFKTFTEMLTGNSADSSPLAGVANDAANAITATDGLANSTSGVGKAADKAKKALKGLTGIDEINNLSDTSGDSATSTGGSGGVATTTAPLKMDIDTKPAESKISSLASTIGSVFSGIKDTFLTGFFDGLSENFGGNVTKIKESAKGIITTLSGIFTDPRVLSSASNYASTIIKNLGSQLGSYISIGTTIATNLLGGLNQSLQENKERITKYISSMFDIASEVSNIKTKFLKACADIFSVFSGESAINITSDIISMFTTAFTDISLLTAEFGKDLLEALTKPVIDNKDKIKKALENTLSGLEPLIDGLKESFGSIFDNLLDVYDTKVSLAIDNIGSGFSDTFSTVLDCYNKDFAPVVKDIAKNVSDLYTKYIAPFVNNVIDYLGTFVSNLVTIWKKSILPILNTVVSFISKYFAEPIKASINAVINVVKQLTSVWSGIITALKGIINFLTGVFTLDFKKAWNGIKTFLDGIWKAIKGIFGTVGAFFKGVFSQAATLIKSAFSGIKSFFQGIWNGIKGIFAGVGSWFKGKFVVAVSGIKSAFSSVGSFFQGIWKGIKGAFANVTGWFKGVFTSAWQAVKNVFSSGGKIFDGIKDGIVNAFKTIVNGLITGINKVIAFPFNKINDILNSISDVSILGIEPFGWIGHDPLPVPQIPKLAKGGIIDAPTLAMVGEAGKEAVMPLENNTGWIDLLASKLAQSIPQNQAPTNNGDTSLVLELNIGGTKFGKVVIESIKKAKKKNGRVPIDI